jgi:ABC-2 type transport system ATP-binding protein
VNAEQGRVTVPVSGGSVALIRVARALEDADVAIEDITLRHPTLDEVFLQLTENSMEATV